MIFLFFGTSLALLEAELAPFKDLEEIGNICEFSGGGGVFCVFKALRVGWATQKCTHHVGN